MVLRVAPSVPESRSPAATATATSAGAVQQPGRPGGEQSRARIVEQAGRLFARNGFETVSIRAIARAADVNVAAIGYHFGHKKGLYQAVMARLIADTRPLVLPMARRLREGVEKASGDPRALAILAGEFVRYALVALLTKEHLRWQHQLMLREFAHPTDCFPEVMRESIHPMHDALGVLVAAVTGGDERDVEVRLQATHVIGQCMIYGISRPLVAARMGWADIDAPQIEILVRTLTGVVQRGLGLPEILPDPRSVEAMIAGSTQGEGSAGR